MAARKQPQRRDARGRFIKTPGSFDAYFALLLAALFFIAFNTIIHLGLNWEELQNVRCP